MSEEERTKFLSEEREQVGEIKKKICNIIESRRPLRPTHITMTYGPYEVEVIGLENK
jgi:hypothetical protein